MRTSARAFRRRKGPPSALAGESQRPGGEDPKRQWEDEVFYVLSIPKFFNGDPSNDAMLRRYGAMKEPDNGGYWGGDLAGVIRKLPYLSRLGVTTLFLSPVVQNDRTPFGRWLATGYRPMDYFAVDENLGDMKTLKDLVRRAHARKMRVVLDMPLALPGIQHPFYTRENAAKGWFGDQTVYGVRQWNAEDPEVADYLIKHQSRLLVH